MAYALSNEVLIKMGRTDFLAIERNKAKHILEALRSKVLSRFVPPYDWAVIEVTKGQTFQLMIIDQILGF